MADRQAQEFWDRMWYWERYETFPDEQVDDPHLVVQLSAQVDQVREAGQEPDPDLMRRYDHCVGRVLAKLTDLLPRSGEDVDMAEVANWLRFGLDPNNRGHDQAVTPIIDADSLIIFLFFTNMLSRTANGAGSAAWRISGHQFRRLPSKSRNSTKVPGVPLASTRPGSVSCS